MNSQDTTLRIRTVDGEVHEFTMPSSAGSGLDYTIGSRLEKLLNQRSIALEVEDRLLIIPMEQIRSIEVFPLAGKLPEAVVPSVKTIRSPLTAAVPVVTQKRSRLVPQEVCTWRRRNSTALGSYYVDSSLNSTPL